jgi:hypothetical protein
MYDYGFLEIREHLIIEGYSDGFFVGTCKLCHRRWSTAAMDRAHGVDTLRGHYRKHVKPHSNELCNAGIIYYSTDYERYRLGIRTPQNDPASRYNK